MSQRQQYVGRFTLPSTATQFNIKNANGVNINCVINTGTLFITGATEAVGLDARIQAAIRAQATGHSTANVTYSGSTGRVTIGLNHNSNIYFGHAPLANILGFDQEVNAADTNAHVGTRQPRYIWRPTRGVAEAPLDINTWWGPRSTSKLTRSVDGSVVTVQGNLVYDGRYSYRNLPQADITSKAGDTDWHRPLERFWEDVVHAGKEIRVYPERTGTAYETGFWASETDMGDEAADIGAFRDQVGRRIDSFDGLWDLEFAMLKNV